jgi:hypothetical protein
MLYSGTCFRVPHGGVRLLIEAPPQRGLQGVGLSQTVVFERRTAYG